MPPIQTTAARSCTAGVGPAAEQALALGEREVLATITIWPRAVPGWEVRLFSTAGISHMFRHLAQLKAMLAGGCALTVGTCASLRSLPECHKIGGPACLKHMWLGPQPRAKDSVQGKGLLLPLF